MTTTEPTLRDLMAAAYRAGLQFWCEIDDPELTGDEPWRHREYSIMRLGREADEELGRLVFQVAEDHVCVAVKDADRKDEVWMRDPAPSKILAAGGVR